MICICSGPLASSSRCGTYFMMASNSGRMSPERTSSVRPA
ncbi:Uncharacterised protein [Bordetella pertussis]|nr:Uncharacterised protein [Bordetella pertussis]CFW28789.1 Uncharacterised protein [Bordetella pertussis]CPM47769.1 Uncharacterised protein [Bordetella pertussis]